MTCKHTPCPSGVLAWHEWAERMMKNHKQIQCPVCGLWLIWIKKSRDELDYEKEKEEESKEREAKALTVGSTNRG